MSTSTYTPGRLAPDALNAVEIEDAVESLLHELDENAAEVVDEGGVPLLLSARDFLSQSAIEILCAIRQSPKYNANDILLTPFAASDGGAYLLVDYSPSDKRITIRVFPDGLSAAVSRTGPSGSLTGTVIELADHATRHLVWLVSID